MSGLIVACTRSGRPPAVDADAVRRCAARLQPRDGGVRPARLGGDEGLVVATTSPTPGPAAQPGAELLGALVGRDTRWRATGGPRPEGSYALCRHDETCVELVTDNLASRALWYVHTPSVFVASTSQRAVVHLLGSFELDAETVAWMVSSGTLGPGRAWDARLRRVPAAGVLSLDRTAWELSLRTEPLGFAVEERSDDEHLRRWREAIVHTCAELDVAMDAWVLPLSGGLDSRVLLAAFMEAGRRPTCLTWGLRRSLDDPENDATVARRLCEAYGLEFDYLPTDPGDVPAATILMRYLEAGEGRTDEIAGYLDGLAMWRRFSERGIAGVIRGDEPAWGYGSTYHSETYVRRRAHLQRVADYPEGSLVRRLGLAPQSLPDWLARRPAETLIGYRERVYESTSLPTSLAPLNDVKAAYVEVVSPFLADRVMRVAHALPEHLKEKRRGFTALAAAMGPPIPEAKRSALVGSHHLLGSAPFVALYASELGSADAERVADRRGLDAVLQRLRRSAAGPRRRDARSVVRAVVPRAVRRRLQPDPPLSIDPVTLALRLVIASRMARMLGDDAATGGPLDGPVQS